MTVLMMSCATATLPSASVKPMEDAGTQPQTEETYEAKESACCAGHVGACNCITLQDVWNVSVEIGRRFVRFMGRAVEAGRELATTPACCWGAVAPAEAADEYSADNN